ncbi:hypothetical protein Tco_1337044 [Tanacetum coccineum]
MAFLTAVSFSRFPSNNNQLRTSSNLKNQATIQDDRVTMQQVQGRQGQSYASNSYKGKATSLGEIMQEAGKGKGNTEDLDAYDSDYDDVSNAKEVLMANLSNYGSDVISEVPHHETYHTDMDNQSVHTMQEYESKEKESKYMDKEIDLEKKIKELDNIVYNVGQSAQIVHMLTKPQVFFDDTHKQALSYQNPFYLKKAQRIKLTLYGGSVIASQHAACLVIDDEETLILEEVSRSKMLAKQNDPMSKEKKVNTTPNNYVELNRLSKDFGKRFVPQQELSD